MVLVKVLKRKDASSVVAAVAMGLVLYFYVAAITPQVSAWMSGLDDGQYASGAFPGTGWQGQYLYPTVLMVVQIVAIEVVLWVYTGLMKAAKTSK